MKEETGLFLLVFVLLIFLVYLRRREGRYLRRKTSQALSTGLRHEIEEEREKNLEKKQKFEEALKNAGHYPDN